MHSLKIDVHVDEKTETIDFGTVNNMPTGFDIAVEEAYHGLTEAIAYE